MDRILWLCLFLFCLGSLEIFLLFLDGTFYNLIKLWYLFVSCTASKGYKSRHRRGKSETLRVQYINTKDVRFGSWLFTLAMFPESAANVVLTGMNWGTWFSVGWQLAVGMLQEEFQEKISTSMSGFARKNHRIFTSSGEYVLPYYKIMILFSSIRWIGFTRTRVMSVCLK